MQDRAAYVRFIETSYFGNVSARRLDAVMDCFTADARVRIRHGDHPERRFAVLPKRDEVPLRDFYEHLCSNYEASFDTFHHVVDMERARAASYFDVRLRPESDGPYAGTGDQHLMNCNFFAFADNRISDMIIYYTNPSTAAQENEKPTGYP